MISQQTATFVAEELLHWSKRHGVKSKAVLELLLLLNKVPGNKSFKDSIPQIQKYWIASLAIENGEGAGHET